MECLHGEFDVEPGNGGDRCDYLRERGIETYLVVVPKGPVGKNGINGVVSQICHTPTQQTFEYSDILRQLMRRESDEIVGATKRGSLQNQTRETSWANNR